MRGFALPGPAGAPPMPNSPMHDAFPAYLHGLLMMAGLIVAIGAQNALVLRQGLLRQHVLPVVVLCTASDVVLVVLGVFGLGALITASPLLLQALRFGGAAFLVGYGLRAAWRAWRGHAGLLAQRDASGLRATLVTTLALTYLNPHVYLDTVVLFGSVGAAMPPARRLAFVLGGATSSALWFSLLGFGAAASSRALQRPAVWRGIDALVAVVMLSTAYGLLVKPG